MPRDPEIVKIGGRIRREFDLVRRYGITEAQYNQRLIAQGGLCAVCRGPETMIRRGRVTPLMVDHDHQSGRVRGLVCNACNQLLGWLQRTDDRYLRAVAYLAAEAVA